MSKKYLILFVFIGIGILVLGACTGTAGPAGPQGPQGPAGPQGQTGPEGPAGAGLTEEQTKALETAGNLAAIQFPALDEVRRGCPACHALVNPETGQFTLPYAAIEPAE